MIYSCAQYKILFENSFKYDLIVYIMYDCTVRTLQQLLWLYTLVLFLLKKKRIQFIPENPICCIYGCAFSKDVNGVLMCIVYINIDFITLMSTYLQSAMTE